MDNDKVIVKIIDNTFVKVHTTKSIARELSDYFTFYVPGYMFTPSFRNKIWDGKIRLLNLNDFKIYRGLVYKIEKFCREKGYDFECDDELQLSEDFSVYHAKKFLDDIKPKFTPHDHQLKAFISCIRNKRRTMISPTASGKSFIIYLIVRQLLQYKCDLGLLVVPSIGLVRQMVKDMQDYGWDVETGPTNLPLRGTFTSLKYENKELIISTWQGLKLQPPELFKKFEFLIYDEVHLAKSNESKYITENCTNAEYKLGFTGTLDGTKTHQLVIEGLFGPVEIVATTKELMEKKIVSDLKIKTIVLKHTEENCEAQKGNTYAEEIAYLINSKQRNKFIKNLALSLDGVVLLLYQYVDKHGDILKELIESSEQLKGRPVYYINGTIKLDKREKYRQEIMKQKDAIIIASYGTYSTGVNIPNIKHVIFASPSKGRIRNLQSIGRSIRLSDDKAEATLYDIADDLRLGEKSNHTLEHLIIRLKIYNSEKFDYKLYKVKLKNE